MTTDMTTGDDSSAWADAHDALCRELGFLLVCAGELEAAVLELYQVVTRRAWPDIVAEARGWTLGVLVRNYLDAHLASEPAPHVERARQLQDRLHAAIRGRNHHVHAIYRIDTPAAFVRGRHPRAGVVRAELVRMQPQHVRDVADELARLTSDLQDLLDDAVTAIGEPPAARVDVETKDLTR